MGYTHYWHQPLEPLDQETFDKFAEGVKKIIAASGVPIVNGLAEAGTEPQFTSDMVRFNGVEKDGCETASFYRDPMATGPNWLTKHQEERGEWFDFCKTRYRPYDKVVTASILLFHHLFPCVTISSDGNGEGGWREGQALLKEATGIEVPLPDAHYYEPPSGPWPE